MKKILTWIAVLVLALTAFGCQKGGDPETIRLVVPDGAPALAVAKVLDAGEVNGKKVEAEVVTAEVLQTRLRNGEYELAIAPTNMGATLYNNKMDLKMISANTYGLLYLVGNENGELETLSDLKGKVVQVIGQGQTPDLVFGYILDKAGIAHEEGDAAKEDTVVIQYVADGTTIVQGFTKGDASYQYAVLGEPAATTVINNANAKTQVREYFDLQEEFKLASGSETLGYPQASLFARGAWLTENAETLEAVLALMEENTAFLKEDTETALAAYEAAGGAQVKSLTAAVVDRMNLKVVAAPTAKPEVETYLKLLNVACPDEGFYYGA